MSEIRAPPGATPPPSQEHSEYASFADLFETTEWGRAGARSTQADTPAAYHVAQGAAIRTSALTRAADHPTAYEAPHTPGEPLGVDPMADSSQGAPW